MMTNTTRTPLRTLLLSLALLPALALAATGDFPNRALIPILKADDIMPRCERGLAELEKMERNLSSAKGLNRHGAGGIFRYWNSMQTRAEDLVGPVALLMHVSPDPEVRKNAAPCLVKVTRFATQLYQNHKIYAHIKNTTPSSPEEEQLRQDILDGFDDTGVSLPPKKQARMQVIVERLTRLKQDFSRNVRDNQQKLTFTPEEMKGLPDDYLKKAKRDKDGNYLLGFAYPEYLPFMRNADSSEARKRYQIAFTNRGTPENLKLMAEAIRLRHEMAGLFGQPSYADFVLRRRMAKKPENVNRFLADVKQAVTELEQTEIETLRNFKAQTLGADPATTELPRWDVGYWQQKMKKALYDVDQNELRKYFPTKASVKWTMALTGTLYGIQFKPADVPVWHKDVRYFDVIDSQTQQLIGGVYLDLYPRDGKYSHAAAFGLRGVSTLVRRKPVSVLVANFNDKGLDQGELETLLHEFGHLMHGVLSKTRFVDHAGTSVERDFVEAPSQLFEHWARHLEPLALLPTFCEQTCPAVDADLMQRLKAARTFGRGMRYARQHLYASFDMALHQHASGSPLQIWQRMETATPFGYLPGTEFPGQFNHLMGGYAAGYYGYMWAEVLALDMLSKFEGKLMNPEVGHAYRKTILERGGELDASLLVRQFLGREPSNKAFFEELSGTVEPLTNTP